MIGLVAAFGLASLIYRVVAGPTTNHAAADTAAHPHSSPTSPKVTPTTTRAARGTAKPSAQPTDLPRLDHQGDGPLNCALRYATEDGGDAGWTAFASHPGVLEMRATTLNGRTYAKSWAVTTSHGKVVTVTTMSVPVPLTELRAVTGTLTDADTAASYACLVGPEAR